MKLPSASLLLIHGNMFVLEGGSHLINIYEVFTEGWAQSLTPSFMSSFLGPNPLEKIIDSRKMQST